jgi:hypothetical protein
MSSIDICVPVQQADVVPVLATKVRPAERVIRPSQVTDGQISFMWQPNVSLVELVYEPGHELGEGLSFIVRDEEGIRRCTRYSQSRYKPLEWIESYARSSVIRLASEAAPYGTLDELATEVRAFIHRYFDADTPFESVATLYVLLTWVYERFHAVPYLRFIGPAGIGKTRGTETIAALCYRSLAIAGSATAAALFRMLEATSGTVMIDEADFGDSQIGSDIIKVLNCGYQKNLAVTRMEKDENGNFVPRLFQVFGPKIINGRLRFKDDATESRCLPYTPFGIQRSDIPMQLPEGFEDEARGLRNKLLQWRLDTLDTLEVRAVSIPGLSGRMNQITAPLMLIAEMLQQEAYKIELIAFAQRVDSQVKEDHKATVEARLIDAYVFLTKHTKMPPTCKELADEVKKHEDDASLHRWLTPRKASSMLRNMGFEMTHTRNGAAVRIDEDRLRVLCERFGIVTNVTESSQGEVVSRVN